MKTNSTIYPKKYIESKGLLFIVDLGSIEEVKNEEVTTYSYNMYQLPIAKRNNLGEYIENNYETLLRFAIDKSLETKPKTELEKLQEIVDMLLLDSLEV